jgi:phenylalanyl-tRNA synthetase beta chain
VRLFESGLRFLPAADDASAIAGVRQTPTLAAVITGRRDPESWSERGEAVDFYDIKGDLEAVFALAADPAGFSFSPGQRDGLHPGQTATVWRAGQQIGFVGAVHPSLLAEFDIAAPVYAFEVDLEPVLNASMPAFSELSRYPEVRRDLAVVVDKGVAAAELLANVRNVAGTYLTDLRLFDVYEGKGIDPKRKSLALGLTFRDSSRTLSDEDVNTWVDQVIDLLDKTYKAELRS